MGCELAQAFRRLGSEVTLLSDATQLLPRDDADGGEVVRQALLRDGVRLIFGARITGVEHGRHARSSGTGTASSGRRAGGRRDPRRDGSRAEVEELGLEAAGVRRTAEGVVVDDYLRTTNRRIYAAGDVCLRWKFTDAADAAARIVVLQRRSSG